MKIKSLLLGSAAALVAVSGARAADAVIIPEPEMVEYVRVCDAAGAGYFYIPGSETCLKISGWARFQIDLNTRDTNFDEDLSTSSFASTGQFNISSWTDSEIGPIETYLEFETPAGTGEGVDLDVVYLSFAGLKMGYFGGFLDNGINGETDGNNLNNTFNSIQYSGTAGAISFGAAIDQFDGGVIWDDDLGADFGVEGMLGFSSGAISASIVGFYDIRLEGGGFVVRGSADIGMGTLQGRFTWAEDVSTGYTNNAWSPLGDNNLNWVAEASYAAAVGDKLTLTPGFSWMEWYDDDRAWVAGLTADYTIAANLALKAHVEYYDYDDGGSTDEAHGWNSFLRFQASF